MSKKRNVKIKRWYKSNKKTFWLLCVLFIFPLIIGVIYAFPLPRIIALNSGDLLAYYGTAFGIIGMFITYRNEVKKEKKERTQELKPVFTVEVTLLDKISDLFKIDIHNHSEQPLSHLYFYDEFVATMAQKKYSFQVTYSKAIEEIEAIKPQFNITMDSDIIDSDGYPKYIQLLCDDKDGNAWNCCYYKVKDCDKIYYYPRDFEII